MGNVVFLLNGLFFFELDLEIKRIFCIFVYAKLIKTKWIMKTNCTIKVYVVNDKIAIQFIEDNDIDGFKEYLAEEGCHYFAEPETFDTEAEALAFCAAIGHGCDERATPTRFPLLSNVDIDLPFINAIREY